VGKEYILGSNGFFVAGVRGIEKDALTIERPYVFTKMRAAPKQIVWFYDKYATPTVAGGPVVQKLVEEKQLELNAFYVIYVGDFRLELNLRPTPHSDL
jgi:hypothetical protein